MPIVNHSHTSLLAVPRRCFFCGSFLLFMFHVSLCYAVLYVPCVRLLRGLASWLSCVWSQFLKIRSCCKRHYLKRISRYRCSPVCSCSQAREIKFLLSGLSSCEQSLQFMPIEVSDQRMLWYTSIFWLSCVDALHPNQQF